RPIDPQPCLRGKARLITSREAQSPGRGEALDCLPGSPSRRECSQTALRTVPEIGRNRRAWAAEGPTSARMRAARGETAKALPSATDPDSQKPWPSVENGQSRVVALCHRRASPATQSQGSVDIADLFGPEPLHPAQRSIDLIHTADIDDATFFEAVRMAQEQVRDLIAQEPALFGQSHPHRTPVDFRPLMVHIAQIDQLFEIIADVRTLVITAAFQLTRGHLIFADVEQEQGLNRIDLQYTQALELILDDIKQQSVQAFYQAQIVEIAGE